MTSRGLNEYMSTVNAFGTNTQSAQNYAKNYRKRGEDAYNNKLADWRSQAEQKTASILEAAQEKYQGQLAKGKEVIESSMGAYGAAKGAKAAFNTFQRVKAAGLEREARAKSLFADESPVDTPTASTLFGGSEEAPKPTETSMADSEVSDITSSTSDVPATDGAGDVEMTTFDDGMGTPPPLEGEAAEGAGEAAEATEATSAFETAQASATSFISGASDAVAGAGEAAASLGEGLLGEAAATIGGDAVVGEALIAAGPEAILAAGAIAGVAYGVSDLMKHINHKDTPSAEDIAKKLPARPGQVDFVANSVNQAKSSFISGAFDSVNDVAGSVAAF